MADYRIIIYNIVYKPSTNQAFVVHRLNIVTVLCSILIKRLIFRVERQHNSSRKRCQRTYVGFIIIQSVLYFSKNLFSSNQITALCIVLVKPLAL